MTFQFQCPSGHLLSGDPAHAGQQCTCPTCGIAFIIPAPVAPSAPPPPSPPAAPGPGPPTPPTTEPAYPPHPPGIPAAMPVEMPAAIETPAVGPAPAPAAKKEERLLHIPCPNGHELECPPDMLGQDVLCPDCNAQFTLREKDGAEYKRRKQRERERKEKQLGDAWFNFAVVLGVVVLLGIVAMGGMMWFGEPPKVEDIPRRPPPTFGQQSDPELESNPDAETNPADAFEEPAENMDGDPQDGAENP